tara:strand:+ start:1689 stop:3392 length:1704 start_codon:yes stop_codon:yes gene_type:complete
MISRQFIDTFIRLFKEKKYQELIDQSDILTSIEERPAGLSNLIGLSKNFIEQPSKEHIISSLDDFKDAYLKGKKEIFGLEALCNLITISSYNRNKFPELYNILRNTEKFYLEAEINFENNEKLLIAGCNLFKHLINQEKVTEILEKLIKNNTRSKAARCNYAYNNNFSYSWDSKKYFEYSQEFKNFFPKYNCKKISEINYKDNKKIKLGFVSGNLCNNHSVTYFLKKTFKYINRKNFEIHIFSFGNQKSSKIIDDIKDNIDFDFDISNLQNQKVIDLIQSKKINILIDLMGVTDADRIEIFNNRVCPIQISWLGYCNTIGFDTIDHIIADKNLIKDDEKKYYLENILELPSIWNAHSGFDFERNFNEAPFIRNGYITFGSFGNFRKISDEVVEAWSNILKSLDNSKLILKSSENCESTVLIDKFKNNGLEKRIKIYDRSQFSSLEDHLNLYKKLDIALDTFPYNGVTTTFEALWMGVPVIGIKGYNFNSRCGESILKNANLNSFIASDKQNYVDKALYFSKNINLLEEVRKKLFDNVLFSPIFNSEQFAIDFSKCMHELYMKQNLLK